MKFVVFVKSLENDVSSFVTYGIDDAQFSVFCFLSVS
jgi:hypothetical protein